MDFRRCGKCGVDKLFDLFSWKNKSLEIRHSVCKDCHAKYREAHYLSNRSKYIRKAQKWNGDQRLKLQRLILGYLVDHPCIDCGERDPVVLDFDHVADKVKGVAEMLKNCYSIKSVVVEIAKCEVRCANCHRRKSAKDFGYWKRLSTGV